MTQTHLDVPLALRKLANPAEAFAERDASDWGQALRATRTSLNATEAEREEIRRYGLVMGRGPANLGERSLGGDRLGREVLAELARRLKR